ncbi:MAG: aspartate kinase, partial [Sediminibacterium sp.]|nr:aspartate kinase [Sediminibacterium sp.]
MQVIKFGGSSVANAENIQKVIAIAQRAVENDTTILVVSALGGITDSLLKAASVAASGDEQFRDLLHEMETRHLDLVRGLLPIQQQSATLSLVKQQFNLLDALCEGVFLLRELSFRTKDKIVSYGELLSSLVIVAAFQAVGNKAVWLDSRELIITDSNFGMAAVQYSETNNAIQHFIEENPAKLYVAPGFISSDTHQQTTTLGRGGSDYTAAIYAAALDATVLEIWTDVSGMMTADPRLVQHPRPIPSISYQEAMELSHFGAKIIYPPTIQPVMNKHIPVWIKNTFAPEDIGTVIQQEGGISDSYIRGITSISKISLLSLEGSGMVGIPGFSKRLFESLAAESVNVILITQSSSEHSICVAVNEGDAKRSKIAIDQQFAIEIASGKLEPLLVESGLAILALVGEQMKSHPGVSGKMFGVLGRNGINVRAIAQGSSEKNISAVLLEKDVKKAINVLHEAFFETTYKQLNVFIAGTGNVGGKLISQIQQQISYLQEHLRLQIRITGLANSKKILLQEEGIQLHNWR